MVEMTSLNIKVTCLTWLFGSQLRFFKVDLEVGLWRTQQKKSCYFWDHTKNTGVYWTQCVAGVGRDWSLYFINSSKG